MEKTENNLPELQDDLERLQAFMSHSPMVAFMKDENGRYVYANKKMENMFHTSFSDLQGKTDFDWLPQEIAQQVRDNDLNILETGQTVELFETVPTPDSIPRHWLVIKFPFTNKAGEKFVGGVAVDFTKHRETEEKLRRSEQHYRHLIEDSQGFICTHDRAGKILSINPAAAHALGYSVGEATGKNMRDFMDAKHHAKLKAQLELVWQNKTDNGFLIMLTKDGREQIWKYHNIKLTETVDKPFILGYSQDVTDMHEIQKNLASLSLTDDLTSLYNRRGFLMLAKRHLKIIRSRPTGKGVYLIFADIDGLKQINDAYGHAQGSLAITKISEILAGNFRASDVIARLGGDEFVVLVTDADEISQEIVLKRLQSKIENYNAEKNHPFDLSLSVGVTTISVDNSISIEDLIVEADKAMYENKRSKKRNYLR
jgi:diguanylate cyclase (GGDEF)-like protein/PAS domain S-box-containing protein